REACPGSTKILDQELSQLEGKRAYDAWMSAAQRRLRLSAESLDITQTLGARLLAAHRLDDLALLLKDARLLFPHDAALMNLEAAKCREEGNAAGEKDALMGVAVGKPK